MLSGCIAGAEFPPTDWKILCKAFERDEGNKKDQKKEYLNTRTPKEYLLDIIFSDQITSHLCYIQRVLIFHSNDCRAFSSSCSTATLYATEFIFCSRSRRNRYEIWIQERTINGSSV